MSRDSRLLNSYEKFTYKISENLLNHVVGFYSLILPGAGKNPTFIQIRGEIFCPGVIFYFGKETENETQFKTERTPGSIAACIAFYRTGSSGAFTCLRNTGGFIVHRNLGQ